VRSCIYDCLHTLQKCSKGCHYASIPTPLITATATNAAVTAAFLAVTVATTADVLYCRNYASRLYKEHTNTARFSADAPQMTKLKFSLKHYAGEVVYSVETFCDKNKVCSHYYCSQSTLLHMHAS
jgi:Myosin head (motor domain)